MIRLLAKLVRNAELGVASLGLGFKPAGAGGVDLLPKKKEKDKKHDF